MTAHTIDEALAKFDLIAGTGDGEQTACTMTALSWVNGDAWSDRLACANRIINSAAITANDAPGVTAKQRAELVRAGETGVLDTWWVPDVVVAWALGQEPGEWYPRVLAAVRAIAAWKDTRHDVRANLRDADLVRANLRDADLGGADLVRADLRGANLRDADLVRADLRGANLRDADLVRANLRDADLGGADLGGADLRGANLRDANLVRANLGGANLVRADLRGANLRDANLRDAYYSQLTLWPTEFDPSAAGARLV